MTEKNTFCIGLPHMGEFRAETALWLTNVAQANSGRLMFLFRSQQPVDVNRNEIVYEFLKSDKEWLLFLDSDMRPNSNLLLMANRGKEIISAMVTAMQNGLPYPIIMKRHDKEGLLYTMVTKEDIDKAVDGVIETEGVGTGALLINRSVFERIKPPWFDFTKTEEGKLLQGEDYYFSKKCKDAGIQMFVDTTHQVGHMKTIDLADFNRIMYKVISGGLKDVTVIKGQKA